MREKLMRFMQGRYGTDTLSMTLIWSSLICIVLDNFLRTGILNFIGLGLLIYAYTRIFSRNYGKRSAENRWFLDRTKGIRGIFNNQLKYIKIRKTHHIYTCKSCKQKIRIPKGKGKIMVTCPKCKTQFVKRS